MKILSIVLFYMGFLAPALAEWHEVRVVDRLTEKASIRFELKGTGDFPTVLKLECDTPVLSGERPRPVVFLDFMKRVGYYRISLRHSFDRSDPDTRFAKLFRGGALIQLSDHHGPGDPIEFVSQMRTAKGLRVEVFFENGKSALLSYNLSGTAHALDKLPCKNP